MTPIEFRRGVAVKLEFRNPSGSIKDRPARFILQRARLEGATGVVEGTSGNTGIGLAFYGPRLGMPVTIVMPRHYSEERQRLLKGLGARLILVEGGVGEAVEVARELAEKEGLYWGDQFRNRANWEAHYYTTAPEILIQFPAVERVVIPVGTGGTLVGVGKGLKGAKPVEIVAVEPAEAPVLFNRRYNQNLPVGPHSIEGIGAGFLPPIVEEGWEVVDRVELVSSAEVEEYWRELLREGFLGGLSAAAAVLVGERLNRRKPAKTLVLAPDGMDRYYSRL
jgi:cysteine synthase A